MSKIGEITGRLILGPAEMVGEYGDAGDAIAAKANLDVFLNWAFTAPQDAKNAPPAVALIVNQCKLDPANDRPRKADWGGKPPPSRLEGSCIVLDAPRSKAARDVVRKIMTNSKPKRIYDRPKRGGTGGGGGGFGLRIAIVVGAFVLLLGAAAGAFWFFKMRGG